MNVSKISQPPIDQDIYDIFDPEKDDPLPEEISIHKDDEFVKKTITVDKEFVNIPATAVYLRAVIDYTISIWDLYRSSIPSSDEMLIRNLKGIGGRIISRKLQQMDADEEALLVSDEEKNMDRLRQGHSSAIDVGILSGLVFGTGGLIGSCIWNMNGGSFVSALKVTTLTTLSISSLMSLSWNRTTTFQETAREWGFIRINRLRTKLAQIDTILRHYEEVELTTRQRAKVRQLNIAKHGFTQIANRCERIFANNTPYCDRSMYLPDGGFYFSYEVPTEYNRELSHYETAYYRPGVPDYRCREPVYNITPTKWERKEVRVKATDLDKAIHEKLKNEGHKFHKTGKKYDH